jgi:hypothetical protein
VADEKTEKPAAEEKPARAPSKPKTVPMHQPSTGRKWAANTIAEASELSMLGWRWDDPDQDTSAVPSGLIGPPTTG